MAMRPVHALLRDGDPADLAKAGLSRKAASSNPNPPTKKAAKTFDISEKFVDREAAHHAAESSSNKHTRRRASSTHFKIQGGRIVASGDVDELKKTSGMYRDARKFSGI